MHNYVILRGYVIPTTWAVCLYVGVCTYHQCVYVLLLPLHLINHYSDVQMQPVDHIITRSEYLGLVDGIPLTLYVVWCVVVPPYHQYHQYVVYVVYHHVSRMYTTARARVHALCGVSSWCALLLCGDVLMHYALWSVSQRYVTMSLCSG